MERFFPVLLELLSDKSDEVLILDITLITEICSQRTANSIDFQSLNLSDETSNEVFQLNYL